MDPDSLIYFVYYLHQHVSLKLKIQAYVASGHDETVFEEYSKRDISLDEALEKVFRKSMSIRDQDFWDCLGFFSHLLVCDFQPALQTLYISFIKAIMNLVMLSHRKGHKKKRQHRYAGFILKKYTPDIFSATNVFQNPIKKFFTPSTGANDEKKLKEDRKIDKQNQKERIRHISRVWYEICPNVFQSDDEALMFCKKSVSKCSSNK
jgi:hypothetical protein